MERQSTTKARQAPPPARRLHAQSARSTADAHPFLALQRSIGNQAVRRLVTSPYIQAKLQVSTPGDPYEQEADRVADTVMRMPDPVQRDPEQPGEAERGVHGSARAVVQRLCTECEEEKERTAGQSGNTVQRKSASERSPDDDGSVAAKIQAMNGGGSPLPDASRAFFEPRFGADFGQVRVHTDASAAGTARSINAKAFTVGRSIAFGAGQFAPHSREGQHLLAHELTHVVQQSGNGPGAGSPRVSRAETSVQRDLLDDFTDGLASIGEDVVAGVEEAGAAVASGVETVGSEVAGGVEAAGSAVTSGAEEAGAAVTSGAQAIASAIGSGATTVAEAVESAEEQAAAIGGVADDNTEEALDTLLDWRNLQVNWDSEPGRTIRAWAARLDPEVVRRVRHISPSALFSVVSVPDDIRQARESWPKQSRADFEPSPILDPRVRPGIPRTLPPGLVPKPSIIIIVIIIILAILLIPTNTFDEKGFEDKELEKGKKEELERRAAEEKKKNEEEKGRCRRTIPALRTRIHLKTIEELDGNANDFINARFKGENNADDLGFFFLKEQFNFFLAIVRQTKNTILKVCSVSDDTLATSSGNKRIGDRLHAEEFAAPLLIAQLQVVPDVERAGATLFNVCQSPACVKEVVTNPEGCTAVLEGIRDRFLPGGAVVDEPTGFPPPSILIPRSADALLRQLRRRLPI